MQRNNKAPHLTKIGAEGRGYRIHIKRARSKLRKGAKRKGATIDKVGLACSFANSFKASANGWGSPIIPTLLGPLRN